MELVEELFEGTIPDAEVQALKAVIGRLKSVYRFKGSKHEISTPNSVYDHIQGLVRLIDELFKDLPIQASEYRVTLLRMAYMHDAGEVYGELAVLDNVLDPESNSVINKEEQEYLNFCDAMLGSENSNPPELSSKLMDWYKLSTNYTCTPKHYLHNTFKLLDLIEGCQYYIVNAKNPEYVPTEHITRYQKYYLGELGKLTSRFSMNNYINELNLKVVDTALKTYKEYLDLMYL